MTRRFPWRLCLAANLAVLFLLATAFAQTAKPGVVVPLSKVKFTADDPKCLTSATENGDPDSGPSTIIIKSSPKCEVPWHYHTAEEQLIVAQGNVRTEMEGMPAATLKTGGFAMMRSQVKHRFSCESKTECILFVTFDRKYDIVWIKDISRPGK
jgi:quercetin dioxygenase-like cupin family protein